MFATRLRPVWRSHILSRTVSTLSTNPHIKVFPNSLVPDTYILTYLETNPPNPNLAIGTTSNLPPTPNSLAENPRFLSILNEVLTRHASDDKDLQSQAKAFASPGGAVFGFGAISHTQNSRRKGNSTGAGGASAQGGAGGGGRGGWVHLSDSRNPPDFGRIAWPEDILGSVEVDGEGNIIGNFQPSGTYRIVTKEGILGLSPFLREKLVARLKEEEKR